MQVTCSCGKMLPVPDILAGKNARCPACHKVFSVPALPASAPPPPTKIPFQCSCGKKLSAPISAAGKKILCPACNQEITIPPAPKPPAPPANAAPAAAQRKAPVASAPAASPKAAPAAAQRKAPAASAPAAPPKAAPAAAQRKAPVAPARAAPPKAAPAADQFGLDLEDAVAPPPAPKPAPQGEPEETDDKGEYGIGGARCPHCNSDLDAGAQFCVSCGTSLATGKKMVSAKMPEKKKGFSLDLKSLTPQAKKKVAIAAVAILVIAGVAYYVYNTMLKSGRPSAPPPYTAPAKESPKKMRVR